MKTIKLSDDQLMDLEVLKHDMTSEQLGLLNSVINEDESEETLTTMSQEIADFFNKMKTNKTFARLVNTVLPAVISRIKDTKEGNFDRDEIEQFSSDFAALAVEAIFFIMTHKNNS